MENFIYVDSCESTQELLKEQLKHEGCNELTVGCEHQTKGHGRGTNVWEDSVGTLCFSMSINAHEKITFTALEISLLIQQFFSSKGKEIKVKWPNDLISSDGKKCGGVLVQNSGAHYLAGIGLNLFQDNETFGGVYDSSFPIEKKSWIKDLNDFIRAHRYQDTAKLTADWLKSCCHVNCEVRIFEGEQEVVGTFIGLGPHGEACIRNTEGIQHLFNGSLRLV
ncbi:MAG: biotin--[acetyl-CoA-carboxylase] ligase [Bdellovibrionales bacterium]|nr:biotin--[acetyl-CoA-carboxylase] ligase [Bdellovibrionales bacterium]